MSIITSTHDKIFENWRWSLKDSAKVRTVSQEQYSWACKELFFRQIVQSTIRNYMHMMLKSEFRKQYRDEIKLCRKLLMKNRRGANGLRRLNRITKRYWEERT